MFAMRDFSTATVSIERQLAQGFEWLRQGRLAAATQLAGTLLASHRHDAQVLYLASEVRLAAGDADAALPLLEAAIAAAPGQLPLLLKQAGVLLALRRRTEARQVAASAVAVAGNDPQGLWMIGRLYGKCDDPANAARLLAQARAAGGRRPELLYDLAAAQFFLGDFTGAEHTLDDLLAEAPRAGQALYLRSALRRQTVDSNHVTELDSRLQQGRFTDAGARAACLYALAKELEDLEQPERSFTVLTEAATLKRRTLDYDAAAERDAIDAVRKAYTAQVMQAEVPGHEEEGAIFIVGMPRTGTTLVERMLGQHSEVASAGELLDFGQALAASAAQAQQRQPGTTLVEASLQMDFAALGRDYMASARQAAGGSRVFIDKMPVNFIYCGLIRKALPNARLIHLVRDPMDTGYAIYKTLFTQAYHFSYDLDELGAYYATYHRMMQHWHAVMPGQILDVHYEDLVTDTVGQARRIIQACRLDWQDAVLDPSRNSAPATTASAAQVRQPVYTSSVQKWRRHEAGLAPLRARLLAEGVITE
jgi:tetratricopeptide (TPR) repeat protein